MGDLIRYRDMNTFFKIIILSFSIVASDFALSQTAYIRDTIYVPLRTGQGTSFRIIHQGLKTGTRLEVLKVDEDSGYTQVKTSKGDEGWIQSQYLSYEPIASIKLQRAEARLAKLTEENKKLKTSRSDLSGKNNNLEGKLSELETANAALSKELKEIKAISANALKVNEDNRSLTESTQLLRNRIDLLEADNLRLQNDKTKSMWLTGASIAFVFLCAGFFFASRKTKNSSWA